MKKLHVVGFAFSPNRRHVLLIRKIKPVWQRGKLNGVGGKVEPSDPSEVDAMIREFEEETGLKSSAEDWYYYARLSTETDEVVFFRSFSLDIFEAKSMTPEPVDPVPVSGVHEIWEVVPNLRWLVPLALCQGTEATFVESWL